VADSKNQARQGAMAGLNYQNLTTEELQRLLREVDSNTDPSRMAECGAAVSTIVEELERRRTQALEHSAAPRPLALPSTVPVAEDHRLRSGSGLTIVLSDGPGPQKISIVVPLSSDSREESKQPHDLEYLRYRLRNCLSPERLEELKKSQAERVQKWKTERHDGFKELLVGWVWDFAALLPADTPQELLRRLLHEYAELILNDSDMSNGVLSIARKLSREDYLALRTSRRYFNANDIAGDVIAKISGDATESHAADPRDTQVVAQNVAAARATLRRDTQAAAQNVVAARATLRQAFLGPILKAIRWTRNRLANRSGVGKATVQGYWDGTRAHITDSNRTAIAEVLEIDVKKLPV
jgi:hypothetical protein